MLLSMTGFGEARRQVDGLAINVEVRTINSRHFKLSYRSSDGYSGLESSVESLVRDNIRRGTVQVSLRVDRQATSDDYRINTAVLAQDTATEGIGFAIPVDLVRGVVDQIKAHGRVIRGWMGLTPDDLTGAERSARGLEDDAGILLLDVHEDGPAARAGLKRGDVILSMNDEPILDRRQALLISASTTPGERVDVVALRNGERMTFTVIAGERPEIL